MSRWEKQALCQYFHQDLWFPPIFPEERDGVSVREYYKIGKLVCDACPARRTCELEGRREENMNKDSGMYGGVTPEERLAGKDWIKDKLAPKRVLPAEHRYLIPDQDANSRLDIKELSKSLRPVLTKRT